MKEEKPQPMPLRAGQSFTLFIEGGTHVVAWHGAILVEPADKSSVGGPVLLPEGEVHLIEVSGWLQLSAPSGGQVLLAPPLQATAAWPVRFLRALPRMLHLLQREWLPR